MKKRSVVLLSILGTGLVLMVFLLKVNYIFFLKWYFTLLMAGITFYPITTLLFPNFKDKGWTFSKVLGFAIPGLTLWMLSYLKLLKNTSLSAYIVLGFYLIINGIVYYKNREKFREERDKLLERIIISELIFFVVFGFWVFFKCFVTKLDYTTEKFMNYGFLNELYHSKYMPANDMWYSGYKINYYYFGHYLASFFAKISFSQVNETFNLFVALIDTMTFVLPFHIVYHLGDYWMRKEYEEAKRRTVVVSILMGLFAAIAVSVGGSLYFPIYNLFVDRDDPSSGYGKYYYWEDSRYIGYRPDTNDKTINEIVPYSNVIGDMHAHHIDTLFVFITLGLLLDLMMSSEEKESIGEKYHWLKFVALGIILGIQKMTNFWDFPIYLTVMCLVLLFSLLAKYHLSLKTIGNIILGIITIVLFQAIVSLPFSLDLHISANQIKLAEAHSPFYKLCVYWALPTVCVLCFIIILLIKFFKEKPKKKFWKPFFEYISKINQADLFVFITGCCAIGLMIIPEIIYVKDIYDEPFKRANTMYKLCYQAEILFDISSAYILIRLLSSKTKLIFKSIPAVLTVLYISTFGYGINAINYCAKNFSRENFVRLDSTESFLEIDYPNDYKAVQWIKDNIPTDEVIVQRTDSSYKIFPYVSVLTGNPTVLGWHGHEYIWRAIENYQKHPELSERWDNVWYIYNSDSKEKIRELIKKYDISYIYISDNCSQQVWKTANKDLLLSLGDVVFEVKDSDEEKSVYIVDVRNLKD